MSLRTPASTSASPLPSTSGRLSGYVDPGFGLSALRSRSLVRRHHRWERFRLPNRAKTQTTALSNIFTEAWGTNNAEELQTLSQTVSSQLFAFSIFPYAGFLYYLTKSRATPRLMLFGWYFLLAFVGATIPAGIYAKVHYGTTLANVDWLHGGAELFLTMTNLFIVLGTRQAIREEEKKQKQQQQRAIDAKSTLSQQATDV